MGRPPRQGPPDLLTDTELELMEVLWTLGEGSARAVMEALPPEGRRAYTTVATMLRVLEKKGLVSTRRDGRADLYLPLLSREDYELRSVQVLTKKLFDRRPAALVRRLLDAEDLSRDELEDIAKMLEEKLE
jgi:predicted transcriptional regulator